MSKRKLGRGLADVMDVFFSEEIKEEEKTIEKESEKTRKEKKGKIKLSLKDSINIPGKNFYIMEKDVNDKLSINLTPYEEVVYNKLYRLSFGERKNYCQIGYGGITFSSSLKCTRTVKIAVEGLLKKKYIARIKIGEKERKGKGTLYRIFSAEEILSGKTLEGIILEKINTGDVEAIKEVVLNNNI